MTELKRRTLLGAAGSVAVLALAGCTASANAPTADGSNTETKTNTGTKTEAPAHDGGHGEESDFASEADVDRVPSEPADGATVEMTMVSEEEPVFAPEVAWVTVGGSVTWKNVDEDPHTTTAYAPSNDKPRRVPEGAEGWDSGILQNGESFSQTFDAAGVYEYYCTPHEALGMVGVVVVGHPDAAGQAAMSPPQEDIPAQARDRLKTVQERVDSMLSG